jgi:hypothetical protein
VRSLILLSFVSAASVAVVLVVLRRRYREAMHKAALNESTAAGALLLLGWDKLCDSAEEPVLVDPMCGSGTFLIEAALIATRCCRAPPLPSFPLSSSPPTTYLASRRLRSDRSAAASI